MDIAILLSFTAITALLVISPGPNGVLIARTVPTSGKTAGFANVAGFMSAFYLHGTLVMLGVSVILVRSAELFFAVKMLGAAYLCWIGLKALRDAWRGVPLQADVSPARRRRTLTIAYWEGFLTNALNPKVAMFYLAAFPQFLPLGQVTPVNIYTLVCIHSMLNLVWFTIMILLLSRLAAFARGGTFQRWVRGVTGVIFVGFGVKLATTEA